MNAPDDWKISATLSRVFPKFGGSYAELRVYQMLPAIINVNK